MSRRAGVYLRISEDRGGTGLAVDRQRGDCDTLIRQRGWDKVGEYVDNDISAAGRKHRPDFDRLMADIVAGTIDTIVALSLDRLTRNRRDQLQIIETCQVHKVLVALVKGSDVDMTTAVGRAMADMMAVWARMEIEQKAERQRSAIQQAARAGHPGGGPRAFGYRKGGMEIDPDEREVVAELYHRFLAGAGLRELTIWLNIGGFTTPKGSTWRPSSVRVVLANPRNAGLRGIRPIVNEATGLRAQFHDIIAPAQWPAIVDEETWRATVAILRDPQRGGRRHDYTGGNRPRHLLSGIATCGRCGKHMISSTTGSTGKRRYKCVSDMHFTRDAALLEGYVQRLLFDWLRSPDAAFLLKPSDPSVDLDALRSETTTLRARLDGFAADYADGVLDRTQVRTASGRVRERLAAVEAKLAEIGQVDVVAPLVAAATDSEAFAVWDSYPTSTKRVVIAQVMRIRVLRGRPGRPPAGHKFDPATVQVDWLDAAPGAPDR